jgi:predicted SAM-dependent methyltransferase
MSLRLEAFQVLRIQSLHHDTVCSRVLCPQVCSSVLCPHSLLKCSVPSQSAQVFCALTVFSSVLCPHSLLKCSVPSQSSQVFCALTVFSSVLCPHSLLKCSVPSVCRPTLCSSLLRHNVVYSLRRFLENILHNSLF